MRIFKYILVAILLWTSIPEKAMAQGDTGYCRHRISVLPTQLALREFSLFYEYSPTASRAAEFSLGYQVRVPDFDGFDDYSPDWNLSGIVIRGNYKIFTSANNPRFYAAPMALMKLLKYQELNSFSGNEQLEWEYDQFRTVLGAYGIFGYRSGGKVRRSGKIYIDIYAGLGGRFILEHREMVPVINGQPAREYDALEPRAMPDVKLGFKIGACYSELFKSHKR